MKKSLSGLICFLFIFSLGLNAADKLIDVFVDIQTKILGGDMIKARELAEKTAFEEAVKQSTVNSHSPEKVEAFVKEASRYVKTYQKLGERREGEILFVKYRVEVALPAATPIPSPSSEVSTTPESSASHQIFQFEISLNSKVRPPLGSSAVVQFIKETWNLPVQDLRLSRGLIRFQVELNRPLAEAEAQLVQWLGDRGLVKSSELQSLPAHDSEVLPAQPPAGQPSDNPSFKPEIHIAPPLTEPKTTEPQTEIPPSIDLPAVVTPSAAPAPIPPSSASPVPSPVPPPTVTP